MTKPKKACILNVLIVHTIGENYENEIFSYHNFSPYLFKLRYACKAIVSKDCEN